VQAIEQYPDLRSNLQERYQYIMVDEFQDTNLAQLRILFNLTDTPHGDAPNIMAVGDDDQAIYSFQGADVGNIHRFRKQYPNHASVVLTDNYRSSQEILDRAREIIVQASGRLETSMDINKQLQAHTNDANSQVTLSALPSRQEEFAWIAESIKENITKGIKPSEIAVIARRHSDLIALLPYLNHDGIAVNYERRDNVLDDERVQLLELMARICVDIAAGEHDEANSLLPELIAQPMFGFDSEAIWRLSLQAYRNRTNWLEAMLASPTFQPLAKWLLDRAKASLTEPLETFLDTLIGVPQNYTANDDTDDDNDDNDAARKPIKPHRNTFTSPFYQYYFNSDILGSSPDTYLTALEALQTLRSKLREGAPDGTLLASDFLTLIDTYRQLNIPVVSIRRASETAQHAVNLMSAHKSKGLEFDTVYVINSIDSMWGERVRSRSRLIGYSENLAISPNADSYDERIRLYFVAMTRAKRQLYLSYARSDDTAKDTLKASFLAGANLQEIDRQPNNAAALAAQSEIAWHDRLTAPINRTMKELLAPTLENYKLSVTHLNNFIDVTRGGPQNFLLNNLLRFPQAKSANAIYGTLIHTVLQHAHSHLAASGTRKPIEDITGEFIRLLHQQELSDNDLALYSKRGIETLEAFLGAKYDTFKPSQKPELSFAGQGVVLGQARLTGSLDLVDIDNQTITVTDYKTGKPSTSWTGKSDYEKIKLHKYRQQLMFYELLCANSRDYAKYDFGGAVLQFVEPDSRGDICQLDDRFSRDELADFQRLIAAVWRCITTLELPPIDNFEQNYKGILVFEQMLRNSYS
jgi:uvrD/REP helicase